MAHYAAQYEVKTNCKVLVVSSYGSLTFSDCCIFYLRSTYGHGHDHRHACLEEGHVCPLCVSNMPHKTNNNKEMDTPSVSVRHG